jgi:poly-beta-1,6-N-acetyl-D-glucosamine biosynthesis protein PgaD
LAHPLRRVAALLLTVVAWCVWLGMWFVLIATIGLELGYDLPKIVLPSPVSLKSFKALMYIAPYAIAAAVMAVMLAFLYDRLRKKLGEADTRWHPVGLDRLARDAALDAENIARWQQAQILYVEHGPRGRVSNASTAPPGPGQAA